jgi:hypothetical protein
VNATRGDLSAAPSTVAPHSICNQGHGLQHSICNQASKVMGYSSRTWPIVRTCTARTQARCWGARPGLGRWARTLWFSTGCPVTAESPMLRRKICPPPSPLLPSISIIGAEAGAPSNASITTGMIEVVAAMDNTSGRFQEQAAGGEAAEEVRPSQEAGRREAQVCLLVEDGYIGYNCTLAVAPLATVAAAAS